MANDRTRMVKGMAVPARTFGMDTKHTRAFPTSDITINITITIPREVYSEASTRTNNMVEVKEKFNNWIQHVLNTWVFMV